MNINEIKNKLEKKASLKKVAGPLSKSVKQELSVIKDLLKNKTFTSYNNGNSVDYWHLQPPLAKIFHQVYDTERLHMSPALIARQLSDLNKLNLTYEGPQKVKFYDRLSRILDKKYDTLRKGYGIDVSDLWKNNIIKKYFGMHY